MRKDSRIFVAGHKGLSGSAIVRALRALGFDNLLLRTRQELDLTRQAAVDEFFTEQRPEYVFLAAAKVGGILANDTHPAEFLRDNLAIELNVIDAAYRNGVQKLEFLGTSCVYPKFAAQPIREEYLLTGELEPTNEWYAVAKIAGVKMAQAYRKQYGFNAISLMPTNLYGPGDNFDLASSHVLPALIRKFHEAKSSGQPDVVVWGSGAPRRDFLYVDDMAEAAVKLMLEYDSPEIVNVRRGEGSDGPRTRRVGSRRDWFSRFSPVRFVETRWNSSQVVGRLAAECPRVDFQNSAPRWHRTDLSVVPWSVAISRRYLNLPRRCGSKPRRHRDASFHPPCSLRSIRDNVSCK